MGVQGVKLKIEAIRSTNNMDHFSLCGMQQLAKSKDSVRMSLNTHVC